MIFSIQGIEICFVYIGPSCSIITGVSPVVVRGAPTRQSSAPGAAESHAVSQAVPATSSLTPHYSGGTVTHAGPGPSPVLL